MLKKSKDPGRTSLSGTQKPGTARAPAGFPALSSVLTETLTSGFDFAKNLWGGGGPASIPGFVVPTTDVEELDKRITDLRAVESWLALNANLLRTTIQSLEVQRNTIAAIQSFGGSLGSLAQDLLEGKSGTAAQGFAHTHEHGAGPIAEHAARMHAAKAEASSPADAPATPGALGSAWLGFLEDQFNRVARSALAAGATAPPSSNARTGASSVAPAHLKRTGKKPPGAQRMSGKTKG